MSLHLNELQPGMVDWTVQGFVKSRNQLTAYRDEKKGKWFDFRFSDEETTIRIVCFNDCSSKFDSIVEVGKYFTIRDGKVKQTVFKGETSYEIVLTINSEVVEIKDDDISMSIPKFGIFTPILQIKDLNITRVNIIGYVKSISEDECLTIDGKTVIKKEYLIYDEEGQVSVSFWDRSTEKIKKKDLVAIEDATVRSFKGGKIINVISSTIITINPECERATDLIMWQSTQSSITTPKKDISNFSSSSVTLDPAEAFSKEEMKEHAKRELEDIEQKEKDLAIKKKRLLYEINHLLES